jgi:hypothetical protein
MVVFDHWVSNADRRRQNILLLQAEPSKFYAYMIDHGNCFPGRMNWNIQSLTQMPQSLKMRTVHKWCISLLGSRKEITHYIHKIQSIPDEKINEIVGSIPDDWGITEKESNALFLQLEKGKKVLEEIVMSSIERLEG